MVADGGYPKQVRAVFSQWPFVLFWTPGPPSLTISLQCPISKVEDPPEVTKEPLGYLPRSQNLRARGLYSLPLIPPYVTGRSSNLKSPFPKEEVQCHNSKGPLQKPRLHKITLKKWHITFFVRYGIFNFQMQGDRLLPGEDQKSEGGRWYADGDEYWTWVTEAGIGTFDFLRNILHTS